MANPDQKTKALLKAGCHDSESFGADAEVNVLVCFRSGNNQYRGTQDTLGPILCFNFWHHWAETESLGLKNVGDPGE